MVEIQFQDLRLEVFKRLKEMIPAHELVAREKMQQEQTASRPGVIRMPLQKVFQMLELISEKG